MEQSNHQAQAKKGIGVGRPRLYLGKHYHAVLFAILGVVGFIASAWLILRGGNNYKRLSQIILSIWSVGPPLWFFYEYFYHFPKYGNAEAGFDGLKAAQDITAKVWAAIAILLGVFYTMTFS
jgi:hypothetical protein